MQNISNRLSINQRFNKSIIDKSSIDSRVRGLHQSLINMLKDESYDIGYTYKIAKRFSDAEIIQVAEYSSRKARLPGRAFISIMEKKLSA